MKKTLQIQIPEGFKIDNFDINSGVVKFTPIPKNIIERVKSIDDAINELGETDVEVAELRKIRKCKYYFSYPIQATSSSNSKSFK